MDFINETNFDHVVIAGLSFLEAFKGFGEGDGVKFSGPLAFLEGSCGSLQPICWFGLWYSVA